MGKYNVGYHGPDCQPNALDGIATLTNDPLAIKFDNVRQDIRNIEKLKKDIEKDIFESLGVPKEAFDPKN